MSQAPRRICLLIRGGVVHAALTEPGATDLDVYLLDFDTEGTDESDLTTVHNRITGKAMEAYVGTVDLLDETDIDLNDVFPEESADVVRANEPLSERSTRVGAFALMVADEIALEANADPGEMSPLALHCHNFRETVGSFLYRHHLYLFANQLEAAWWSFSDEDKEDIFHQIGSVDFEWVPKVMAVLHEECAVNGQTLFAADINDVIRATNTLMAQADHTPAPGM